MDDYLRVMIAGTELQIQLFSPECLARETTILHYIEFQNSMSTPGSQMLTLFIDTGVGILPPFSFQLDFNIKGI